MVDNKWPTGIRPRNGGIQLRCWRHGKEAYTEQLDGDAYKAADLASAVKRREWLESRLTLGLPLRKDDQTVRKLFDMVAQEYLDTLEVKHSSELSYEGMLNQYWMPAFSGWPIDEIKTADIKKVLSKHDVSSRTKRNVLIPLRGVLGYGEVNPNPANGIKLRKHQKPEVSRYTPVEREKLMNALEGQPKVYFAVLFGCGLRPGEALGLTWSDYDGSELDINKQITRRRFESSTKTSMRRRVYVPQWTQSILNKHTTRFSGEHIFLNTLGTPYLDTDIFNAAWKAAHKRARLPYRIPYTCRHTRASELLSIGVQAPEASSQLGHSIEMFLRTYARWIEEFSNNQDKARFEGIPLATGLKPV